MAYATARGNLFFVNELTIPCGKARIPASLWKATKQELSLYALNTVKKLTEKTPLYDAPFFNIHENGSVCMGTVDIVVSSTFKRLNAITSIANQRLPFGTTLLQ